MEGKSRISIKKLVVREHGGLEHEVWIEAWMDRDDDVECVVLEDVPERVWTRRFGEPQPFETGALAYEEGDDDFELEPEEDEEIRAEIAKLKQDYEASNRAMFDFLRPPDAPGAGAGEGF